MNKPVLGTLCSTLFIFTAACGDAGSEGKETDPAPPLPQVQTKSPQGIQGSGLLGIEGSGKKLQGIQGTGKR